MYLCALQLESFWLPRQANQPELSKTRQQESCVTSCPHIRFEAAFVSNLYSAFVIKQLLPDGAMAVIAINRNTDLCFLLYFLLLGCLACRRFDQCFSLLESCTMQ